MRCLVFCQLRNFAAHDSASEALRGLSIYQLVYFIF